MKTTIDIADELIHQARLIQKREGITLRALVEDGLRLAIENHAKPAKPYKWVPVVVGGPEIDESMTPERINQLIDEAREREWPAQVKPDKLLSVVQRKAKVTKKLRKPAAAALERDSRKMLVAPKRTRRV